MSKVWELAPTQFPVRNPSWQQTLDEIVTRVAFGLGISPNEAGLRAELRKLLIYGEGASLDRHVEYAVIKSRYVV